MSKTENFVKGSIPCLEFFVYLGIDMEPAGTILTYNLLWWPYSFVTLALDGVGGQYLSPALSPRERDPVLNV
jgi:hypothetical protein